MKNNLEVSVKQEISKVKMNSPHVVLLGAGASRAVCLNGDKHGKKLPLMLDFTEIVGLRPILKSWKINPNQNFEEIFSDLHDRGEYTKINEIRELVEDYFDDLELPDKPTIYDHLVLSLRGQDLIATFNWDPLLIQAYLRNLKSELTLPRLAFLHGNIMIGYCEKDRIAGLAGHRCGKCGERNINTPLLYPIKNKNYADNLFIANEWQQLKKGFQNAFMITIFGYSGPKTDQEAIKAMKEAWGNKNKRAMEQTCFITPMEEEAVLKNWKPFIHTHHFEVENDFYKSFIANHPRRTGEAYFHQYYECKFINKNPIPKDLDFPGLWKWFEKFKKAEMG